jgi:antitoxin (DNA-binding transcriptional repressor) of toxin-antitoxin stability system
MVTVGIRELKNRLSEYLRLVRDGDTIQVTDRGTVIAEIRPPGQPGATSEIPRGLLDLARQGRVTLGTENDPSLYPIRERPLLVGVTSAELLDQERGER